MRHNVVHYSIYLPELMRSLLLVKSILDTSATEAVAADMMVTDGPLLRRCVKNAQRCYAVPGAGDQKKREKSVFRSWNRA